MIEVVWLEIKKFKSKEAIIAHWSTPAFYLLIFFFISVGGEKEKF
jgi:hypothetical protein